ncbi:P-loop ATPase, Sll1717 family [Methylobacterium aquaticum]|uniref:P-loop ATPase, Sll1717 family n=1 Tax=Methylobacterium aquaticum TaxID=270351 RepID=UPI003D184696
MKKSRNKPQNRKTKINVTNNLSIGEIYIGEIDTTIELRMGGISASNDFFNSYYVKDEKDIENFLAGKKCFVYGQKGAGKTAFLRYVGEKLKKEKDIQNHTIMYSFIEDFPEQAHREITEFAIQSRSEHSKKVGRDINIFRDLDYEDFWTYLILHSVNKYLQNNGKDLVVDDNNLKSFRSQLSNIDNGSIQDRLLKLVPRVANLKAQISANPSLTTDITFKDGEKEFAKFSTHVEKMREQFLKLTWLKGRVYFMFDEIDPRVGSGKAFDLDCILIRDLIHVIYRLNASSATEERRIFFAAAIRSEVLRSVDKLGKEIHKTLSQLGVHMNWGHYGQLNTDHPLVSMLCKKIIYSENRKGIHTELGLRPNDTIWNKYFRKNLQDSLEVKDLFRLTWLKPRDLVRIINTCKIIEPSSKFIGSSLVQRARTIYSNDSWNEIQSQLNTSLSPGEIEALDMVLTRFFDEFNVHEFKKKIMDLITVNTKIDGLLEHRKEGDLLEIMYIYGIVGNKVGNIHRFYYRGDETPQIAEPFVLHAGLWKKFSPVRRSRMKDPLQSEFKL